jgi:TrwC relaxase
VPPHPPFSPVDGDHLATAFTHRDSRAGDPDLHTHVAVANKVQTLDRRWLSIDGRVLFKANVAAAESDIVADFCHMAMAHESKAGRSRPPVVGGWPGPVLSHAYRATLRRPRSSTVPALRFCRGTSLMPPCARSVLTATRLAPVPRGIVRCAGWVAVVSAMRGDLARARSLLDHGARAHTARAAYHDRPAARQARCGDAHPRRRTP